MQIAYLLLFVITEPREKIRNQNDSIYFEPLIIFLPFEKPIIRRNNNCESNLKKTKLKEKKYVWLRLLTINFVVFRWYDK